MRKRLTFPPETVAHKWAHQAQEEAYDSIANRKFYFIDETIYSYGSHFPIARHYTKPDGDPIILFTSKSYSNTTAGHKNLVKSAIIGRNYFTVPDVAASFNSISEHEANLNYYINSIDEYKSLQKRARKKDYSQKIYKLTVELKEYVDYFELKTILNRGDYHTRSVKAFAEQLAIVLNLYYPDDTAIESLKQSIKAAEDKAAELIRKNNEKQKHLLELWRDDQSMPEGEYFSPYKLSYSALRVKDNRIETTLGVELSLNEGRKLYNLVKKTLQENSEFNGSVPVVSSVGRIEYKTKVDDKGNVAIGCHNIPYAEIEIIANKLNWK